jgi:hypothetical protein
VIEEGATRMFVVFENTVVASARVAWDTLPPAAPSALEAQRGAENEVRLSWNYALETAADAGNASVDADVVNDAASDDLGVDVVSDDRSPAPDDVTRAPRNEPLRRFWVLCEPAAAGDAGASDGSSCASGGFEALDTTREDSLNRFAAQCGLDGGVASSTTAVSLTALTASQQTRFAVVAEDRAGNRSAVAIAATCVSPERYTDFWEQYRQSGGTGTATCGASTRSVASQRAAWFVVLGVALACARRKRRA